MKKAEEVMEILEAYDLAGTLRGAAVLAGCDHKTVAHWVAVREQAGGLPAAERCRPAVGGFAGKIDELVERSHGRIRADVAHGKLVALGLSAVRNAASEYGITPFRSGYRVSTIAFAVAGVALKIAPVTVRRNISELVLQARR